MSLGLGASRRAHDSRRARSVLCSLLAEMAAAPPASRAIETHGTRVPGQPWTVAAGRASRTMLLTPPL
jgi:hypothetical protein